MSLHHVYTHTCATACFLRAERKFSLSVCCWLAVFGLDGEWFIENRGAIPDIVVDNLPHATFAGEDAQLRRGVAELLGKLQTDPIETPVHPPYPDRSYQGPMNEQCP
eukprot:COSAG03_NODE_260_length_9798_cov_24.207238_2_plen_107_part_00